MSALVGCKHRNPGGFDPAETGNTSEMMLENHPGWWLPQAWRVREGTHHFLLAKFVASNWSPSFYNSNIFNSWDPNRRGEGS